MTAILKFYKDLERYGLFKDSQFILNIPIELLREIFDKSEILHKQQIIDAYVEGFCISAEGFNGEYGINDFNNIKEEISAEQYYTSTYGSKGSETKQSLYTKEQLREAFRGFASGKSFEQYYNETYGSNGSDETKQ